MALIAILAAPPDTGAMPAPQPPDVRSLPRVPGTRLRLGMSESQVLALGAFAEVKVPNAGTMATRRATGRFFGVVGEATCYLRDGMLAEVRFEATGVSSHSQDYIDGQLRMMGLMRECKPDRSGERTCDWTEPKLRLHTEMTKERISAHAFPWPPLPDRGSDSSRANVKTTASAVPARAGSTAPTGAAGTAAATAGAAHSTGAPARDSTRHAAAVVVTLPETLTITPAHRDSTVWPRIVSSPSLQYPEKAKRESLQGIVWVTALVDTSGKVMNASIERSIRELDEAALAWVKGSRFALCRKNGAPCRFVVRVAVLFTLY